MQQYCIACNGRYFWNEDDENCTKFVCEDCVCMNPEKDMSAWARLRFRILNRDEFTCRYCGNSPTKDMMCVLHIDHVVPRSKIMSNSEKNLITSCALCNFGKLNFTLTEGSKAKIDDYLSNREEKLKDGHKGNNKRTS